MASKPPRNFVLGSRSSKLAMIQTNIVLSSLQELAHLSEDDEPAPTFSTSFMSTGGDKNQSQALYLMGGKGLWTEELELALKHGDVDMLVHSLKDVPTALPEGCCLGAILEREDPVDSLVVKRGKGWKSLEELPAGSVIGTSSVRRVAQLKRNFQHLEFLDVRGNLNTRLAKLDDPNGPYTALILAKAGLVRLGMGDRITSDIGPPTLFYAVAQGALGIEVRTDDIEAIELCKRVTHKGTQWKCLAERSCLRVLEGGCSVPVGVASALEWVDMEKKEMGTLTLTGSLTSIDGQVHVQHTVTAVVSSEEDAEETGAKLARVLIQIGGRKILDDIKQDKEYRIRETKGIDESK